MRATPPSLIVTLGACLAACATSRSPTVGARSHGNLDTGAEADLGDHHHLQHQGGVLLVIGMALDTLALPSNEQLRVARLQTALIARLQPVRQARWDALGVLADQLAAPKLDAAKVDEEIAKLATASAAAHDLAVEELDQLHALLTPAQRKLLVERLEAHQALWKQANSGGPDPIQAITDEIGLGPTQLEDVRNNLGEDTAQNTTKKATAAPLDETDIQADLATFAKAFRADAFDAKTLVDAPNRNTAATSTTRVAHFCEAINATLSEEQRRNLVVLLREHLGRDQSPRGEEIQE